MVIYVEGLWILELDKLKALLESTGCEILRLDINTEATLAHITFNINANVEVDIVKDEIIFIDYLNDDSLRIAKEDFTKMEAL
jgi:hypothetical protein